MKLLKRYWYFFLILIVTVGLGALTFLLSKQLEKRTPVAPNVPQQKPQATTANCTLVFDLPTPTITPTNTPIPQTPTPTTPPPASCNNTCSTTAPCQDGLVCNTNGRCRNPQCTAQSTCACPTPTPTPTPKPPTPTPTPIPPASCNNTCSDIVACQDGLVCNTNGRCRNPQCTAQTNCSCPAPTATPVPTATTVPNQEPICTSLALNPSSGTSIPLAVELTCIGQDPDGNVTAAEFTFGDGQTKVVSGTSSISTTHSYAQAGSFAASCRIKDNTNSFSQVPVECQKTVDITTPQPTTTPEPTFPPQPTEPPLAEVPTEAAPTPQIPVAGAGPTLLGAMVIGAGTLLLLLGLAL